MKLMQIESVNDVTTDAVTRWQGRLNTVLIEFHIFAVLESKPTYGGEIAEFSKQYLENVKVTTIYSIIRRSIELELIEKVESTEKADVTRGTARQYYELTDEGKHYLNAIRSYLYNATSKDVITQLEEGL